RAFSCAEKVQRRASALSVAGHRQFRVLVAPHQVPVEARRKKKNAASDQVRSFAATRAQLTQIPPARSSATLTDAASIRVTLSRCKGGDAEVANLRRLFIDKQNVGRLHVAMNQTLPVSCA